MRAKVGDIELNYQATGSGPTIVMTHGIGGTGDDWGAVVPGLASRFQVVTYDVRGFGQSSRPATGYSIAQNAKDIAGLLDHLGVQKAVIMGTSMGGTITQRFILDFPERTAAAVIMSTSSEVNERARDAWQRQGDFIAEHGMEAWIKRTRPPEYTDEYLAAHPEIVEQEQRRIRNNPDGKVYGQIARAVADYNYTAELESVRVPTLVLVGSKDTQTPPGGSVIISRRIPGAELHILDGYGHSLPREAPEKVVELVTAFLERSLAGD
jgi:(E)-2-((N-methylformamido)methylene)succinate hydrolase